MPNLDRYMFVKKIAVPQYTVKKNHGIIHSNMLHLKSNLVNIIHKPKLQYPVFYLYSQ